VNRAVYCDGAMRRMLKDLIAAQSAFGRTIHLLREWYYHYGRDTHDPNFKTVSVDSSSEIAVTFEEAQTLRDDGSGTVPSLNFSGKRIS
jgi:hypothetical protein